MRIAISTLLLCFLYLNMPAQVIPQKFGDGIQLYGKDSTYFIHFGFRFQSLFSNTWTDIDGKLDNYQSNLLIRRSRLKFDGYVLTPKLTYKFELGLSNRDISGGDGDEHGNTSNVILDAVMAYKFYKNFSIQFGQTKLPGNRERVISSANLEFVDRSRLNSRFNLDRDIGFQLKNAHTVGQNFLILETISFSQGEGRNIIEGHFGGYDYTFHIDLLPFGKFKSKGDYVGSSIVREAKPKLAFGFTYDINNNAVRERGQLGDFIIDEQGNYFGKTLQAFFADCMFKYGGLSIMAEYVTKQSKDNSPVVFDATGTQIGTFYTGSAYSFQTGYMLANNWEIAGRYTLINPDTGVSNDEKEYTLGVSKFIVGHKLKIQTDWSYREVANRNNLFSWRLQTELHF